MNSIVRGFVNTKSEQNCYYFEGTYQNLANFIFNHKELSKEVVIETIFGKVILSVKQGLIDGNKTVVEQVEKYLLQMQMGEQTQQEVLYLDLYNRNNEDEFDSKDVIEKEFVRLCEGCL